MATHDPRREVEKLREHLASHDKPIAFLVGAGASASVRDANGRLLEPALVPAVPAMGELCKGAVEALGAEYSEAYASLSIGADNIEELLSRVRLMIAVMSETDSMVGITRAKLEEVEEAIRRTIATAALPDEATVPSRLPHHSLARWIGRIDRASPVEIFTTNYDTLLERALEDERIPVFDGFIGSRRPFFSPASLIHEDAAPGRSWTRVWKVHGSVNWQWAILEDGSTRIVRGDESTGGELILPSFYKYDESRKQPYVAMLDRFSRVLTAREDTVLFTIGYSFADQHVNDVIFDALDTHERLHVFALQFSDPEPEHELVTRAKSRSNLLVLGPTTAFIGGTGGEWELPEPVDDRTADLLDIPFDSEGAPMADHHALRGRFRLGDFYWFGRFLDVIAGADA